MTEKRPERRHERASVEIPVHIVDGRMRTRAAVVFDTGNLSVGGAFLRADILLEIDEQVDLELDLGGRPLKLRAKVARVSHTPPAGMGIAFQNLSADDAEALGAFLRTLPRTEG